ncbi:uracil-DNA glycosylase [Pseudomonas syringae group genomosp. 3]|uniref:uracil-DNA glycosylase n=1 Tax=Pseudomonas syringae group genomosp. 3 TaxID=251701 RepID=UPI000F005447|nr:uracil-DNA glycosylase [Pseudomonas syringae group genomosp. 3]
MLLNQKSAEQEISLKVREDFLLLPKTAELTRWVMAQSAGERTLPYFDPLDGGVFARVLILLESPARTVSLPRYVSRDNPGPAQRNLKGFIEQVGLARHKTVLWNLYPWLPDLDKPKGPLRRAQIEEGIEMLITLLTFFPDLVTIVFAGRVAQKAIPRVRLAFPNFSLLEMPHPSPLSVCTHPNVRQRILSTLRHAKQSIK